MDSTKLAPGERITADGLYDLTMAEYHGQPCEGASISSSGLRTIWAQSPAHYYLTSSMNPNRPEAEERPHFSLGRAAHHLLFLGRKGFDAEFVVRPEKWKDWRTAEAREWKADQVAAGRTVITEAELEHITGMARSLAAHPLVKAGILDGAVERSLIFRHRDTGVWLKSRPDNIIENSGDYSDLKTTTSVATVALQRTISEFNYAMQGALVGMASRQVLNRQMDSFTLVFVEKAPPYCCRVVTLRPSDLELGEKQVNAAARVFADCVRADTWPGPGGVQQDAEYLSPAEWSVKQAEERLALFAAEAPVLEAAE